MSQLDDVIATLSQAREKVESIAAPVAAIQQLAAEAAGYTNQAGDAYYGQAAQHLAGVSDSARQVNDYMQTLIDWYNGEITRLRQGR